MTFDPTEGRGREGFDPQLHFRGYDGGIVGLQAGRECGAGERQGAGHPVFEQGVVEGPVGNAEPAHQFHVCFDVELGLQDQKVSAYHAILRRFRLR